VAPIEEAQVAVETQADSGVADLRGADVYAGDASAIVLDDLASAGVTVREMRPGDIILDAELPGPTTSSTSPNVTSAVIATDPVSDNSGPPSWLNWLAGGVIAIVFGLMMFRRRPGGRASSGPETPLATEQPQHRFSDTQSTDTKSIEAPEVDYDISDDSPTEENLVLDADLIMGTGLSDSSTPDISDGFRFAEPSELDVEVPSEPAESQPAPTGEYSILDSEVLPIAADDDYDMSVIIDATKIPQADETAEHDFKAVEVTTGDETLMTQNFMSDKDADFQIIEQDYEDELTATQALNLEIAHAAAELTAKMEIEGTNKSDDETSALPLATVTELEITAQLPARNDEISSPEDNEDSEAVTANTIADEDTIDMPVESGKGN